MKYSIQYGCPKCGNRRLRQITKEKFENITGEKAKEQCYLCPDKETYGDGHNGCGHVWTIGKAVLQR